MKMEAMRKRTRIRRKEDEDKEEGGRGQKC
jgi:hypothetical protein